MLGALALTPVLLVLSIWDSPQLDVVREHPLPALVGGVAAAALVVVPLALLFARRRAALPLAALAALPFRDSRRGGRLDARTCSSRSTS